MAFSSTSSFSVSSEINVTPLIDVLLVLLIIFMVIVPVAPLGLDATLPSANSAHSKAAPSESPVLVEVDGDAAHPVYRIDAVAIERASVQAKLSELLAVRSQRQMLVRAVPGIDFGSVSQIVDEGRAAGADAVGLIGPKR